jgi:hypothetical protein
LLPKFFDTRHLWELDASEYKECEGVFPWSIDIRGMDSSLLLHLPHIQFTWANLQSDSARIDRVLFFAEIKKIP